MRQLALRSLQIVVAMLGLSLCADVLLAGAEQDIDQVEEGRYDAMIRVDVDKLGAILADEFLYHQPSGKVATKASYIESFSSGAVKINGAERYDVKTHVYGDTATVTGSTRVDVEMDGEARQVDLRFLNVWVKREGRWQLVARQSAFKPK
jgi:ketosteroid isomerase-like protein